MHASGLRGHLNLVLLPALAAALALLLWVDYRHEVAVIMRAHMMHESPVGPTVAPNPVPIDTDPAAVARWAFWMHLMWASTVLVVVAALVNVVLQRFVVRPMSDLQHGMVRMVRGDWHPQTGSSGAKEIDSVQTAFREMGPLLEAVVRQALQAERLATLAAISKHVETQTADTVRTLAQAAASLIRSPDSTVRAAGMDVSQSAARVAAVVRSLDTIFTRVDTTNDGATVPPRGDQTISSDWNHASSAPLSAGRAKERLKWN